MHFTPTPFYFRDIALTRAVVLKCFSGMLLYYYLSNLYSRTESQISKERFLAASTMNYNLTIPMILIYQGEIC